MMDWYCNLTDYIFNQENMKIGKDSFQSIQQELETKTVVLYKALLLYQMKSACSFYRHQGLVFLRGLVNLDNWDGSLKSIKDAEAALQKDLDQFYKEHTKASLRRLIETAQSQEAVLGDIRQVLQDNIIQQQEMQNNEKDVHCLKDLRLTDPRHDKTRIEQTKGGLLPGACRWVLDASEFQQWRDDEKNRLLWINGDPGKGKTMLLCGIIDELSPGTRLRDLEASELLSYFFCQATDSRINSATAVLRGLIYLLLDQQPSLICHARNKYDHAGKALFEDANSWVALSDILLNILQDASLKSACIVIDALDECVVDLPKLLDLIVQMLSISPRVKWIVSSRNWQIIKDRLSSDSSQMALSLELKQNADQISRAVAAYIDHRVPELAAIQHDKDLQAQVKDEMKRKASGTFLWVSLVIKELKEADSWDVLQILKEMPIDLRGVYGRMLEQIRGLKRRNPELCRAVLSAATTAYRPLHLAELGVLSGLPPDMTAHESLSKIVRMCGSFFTIRDDIVYSIHQSAQDFLSKDTSLFPSGMIDAHYSIFSRSLQAMSKTLCRNIYGLPSSGSPVESVQQPKPDPLAAVRYSCVYWLDHLHDCDPSRTAMNDLQDGGSVDKFLRRGYLHWLEALSLLKSMSEGMLSMTKLDAILQVRQIDRHMEP
jgi:hypothetical protein